MAEADLLGQKRTGGSSVARHPADEDSCFIELVFGYNQCVQNLYVKSAVVACACNLSTEGLRQEDCC